MVRRNRSQAPAAHRGHAGALRLDPAPCLRVVDAGDKPLLTHTDLDRESALSGLRQQLLRIEPPTDLVREAEPIESARGENDGVEPTSANDWAVL